MPKITEARLLRAPCLVGLQKTAHTENTPLTLRSVMALVAFYLFHKMADLSEQASFKHCGCATRIFVKVAHTHTLSTAPPPSPPPPPTLFPLLKIITVSLLCFVPSFSGGHHYIVCTINFVFMRMPGVCIYVHVLKN